MTRLLSRVPLLILLALWLAMSMQVPALHALALDDHATARAFFYWSLLLLAGSGAVALAAARDEPARLARGQLLALVGAFALLPALAMLPLREVLPNTRTLNLYVEMVMAATTTGGSLFDPGRLPPSAHLWRALVAWQGGLLIWIAAAAILAPLRLGGFEVNWSELRAPRAEPSRDMQAAGPAARIARYAGALAPVYVGLTGALWLALSFAGSPPTEALVLAMSTLSTSGITMAGGAGAGTAGLGGEAAIFAFLVFAVSRRTFASDLHREGRSGLLSDRELAMAAAIVGATVTALFLRHWIGAIEYDGGQNLGSAVRALWGSTFTVLSFLTTTGFVSAEWDVARAWSGLETPGVLLVGLTMFGGGVATTAGGVKLLRVYALYQHGRREMDLLVHPHAVGVGRLAAGRLPSAGLDAAWIFFMLFATALAGLTLALAFAGTTFHQALVLATAGLSTTGPLVDVALPGERALIAENAAVKAVFCAAMVLGRMETLALIALFNPEFWRR